MKFPKDRWKDIRRAEANTPEGDRIFAELRQRYLDKYLTGPEDDAADGDIHGVADLEYGAS